MTSQLITSGTPHIYDRGLDNQGGEVLPVPISLDYYVPEHFILAAKGKAGRIKLNGAEVANYYGLDTFDTSGDYFNHATQFLLDDISKTTVIVNRIIPEDASTSLLILSLVLTPVSAMPDYERDDEGQYTLDDDGNKTEIGTVAGYEYSWRVQDITTDSTTYETYIAGIEGASVPVNDGGAMVYPFGIFEYSCAGIIGNNTGIRIRVLSDEEDEDALTDASFTYGFELRQRDDAYSTPTTADNLLGQKVVPFTFKPNQVDSLSLEPLSLDYVAKDTYENTTDASLPRADSDWERIYLFEDSIAKALTEIATVERVALVADDEWCDLNDSQVTVKTDEEVGPLMNIVTGRNLAGAPYRTLVASSDVDTKQLGQFVTHYASGGADGDLSLATFETAVGVDMLRYTDVEDVLMDDARYVGSIFTDSGYNLDTKLNACAMTAIRKDTAVSLATYEHDATIKDAGASVGYVQGEEQTFAEELAISMQILARASLYPESDDYGTPATRIFIQKGSGKVKNSLYKHRVPTTYWLRSKMGDVMGGADGVWDTTVLMDKAPNHVIQNMTHLSESWVSKTKRTRLNSLGVNYHLSYGNDLVFVPVLKNIIGDDTSPASSVFFAMAMTIVTKVAHKAWRDYSGVVSMTGSEVAINVNKDIRNKLANVFGGVYQVEPNARIRDIDKLRGYSVDLPITIYGNTPNTVFNFSIIGLRFPDNSNG